jgi:hypothetical protein
VAQALLVNLPQKAGSGFLIFRQAWSPFCLKLLCEGYLLSKQALLLVQSAAPVTYLSGRQEKDVHYGGAAIVHRRGFPLRAYGNRPTLNG